MLFGLLVSVQWRTQSERNELTVRYNTPLLDAAKTLQKEQDALKLQLAALRAELDQIQASASTQSGAARELQTRIDELKTVAGLNERTGDGVIVFLDDARGASAAKDIEKSICHNTDLTDIVNQAWRGGATAIAINDERIVGSSSIYCVVPRSWERHAHVASFQRSRDRTAERAARHVRRSVAASRHQTAS